jgi:hypothetical protein
LFALGKTHLENLSVPGVKLFALGKHTWDFQRSQGSFALGKQTLGNFFQVPWVVRCRMFALGKQTLGILVPGLFALGKKNLEKFPSQQKCLIKHLRPCRVTE